MKKSRTEGRWRLGLAAILNVLLWIFVGKEMGMWGGVDREFQKAILAVMFGVPAIVCVIPVFWRGESWQAPLAFVLMPLPGLSLFFAIHFALTYQ